MVDYNSMTWPGVVAYLGTGVGWLVVAYLVYKLVQRAFDEVK